MTENLNIRLIIKSHNVGQSLPLEDIERIPGDLKKIVSLHPPKDGMCEAVIGISFREGKIDEYILQYQRQYPDNNETYRVIRDEIK